MISKAALSGDSSGLKIHGPRVFDGFLAWSDNSLNRLLVFTPRGQMIEKILSHVPAPIIVCAVLFCIFPLWQTAQIACAAFAFIAFKDWLRDHKKTELQSLRDELKAMKSQVEAIQISRSMGR